MQSSHGRSRRAAAFRLLHRQVNAWQWIWRLENKVGTFLSAIRKSQVRVDVLRDAVAVPQLNAGAAIPNELKLRWKMIEISSSVCPQLRLTRILLSLATRKQWIDIKWPA